MKNVAKCPETSAQWADDVSRKIERELKLVGFWEAALEDGLRRSDVGCFLRWGYTHSQLTAKVNELRGLLLS